MGIPRALYCLECRTPLGFEVWSLVPGIGLHQCGSVPVFVDKFPQTTTKSIHVPVVVGEGGRKRKGARCGTCAGGWWVGGLL